MAVMAVTARTLSSVESERRSEEMGVVGDGQVWAQGELMGGAMALASLRATAAERCGARDQDAWLQGVGYKFYCGRGRGHVGKGYRPPDTHQCTRSIILFLHKHGTAYSMIRVGLFGEPQHHLPQPPWAKNKVDPINRLRNTTVNLSQS
jgi:hypothetical protein